MNRTDGPDDLENILKIISNRIDEMAVNMEKMGISEYVQMLNKPRRLLFINFLSGVARGLGMAIGFSLLAALLVYALQKAALLNMPVIGKFIAELVIIVQKQLNIHGMIFYLP